MDNNRTLKNMLDMLCEKNGLVTWQIFEEKSGSIVAKLRFAAMADSHASLNTSIPVTYKRKTASNIQRDQLRSKQHKTKEGIITRSQTQRRESETENPRFDSRQGISTGTPVSQISVSLAIVHSMSQAHLTLLSIVT